MDGGTSVWQVAGGRSVVGTWEVEKSGSEYCERKDGGSDMWFWASGNEGEGEGGAAGGGGRGMLYNGEEERRGSCKMWDVKGKDNFCIELLGSENEERKLRCGM